MAGRDGERLLNAFRAANCPGVAAWTGSDLDWVYEIPGAEEFLDRLASSLNAEAGDGAFFFIGSFSVQSPYLYLRTKSKRSCR